MGLASVQTDIAPLYERPAESGGLCDEALYGMNVQVIDEQGPWCYVRTDYGTEGYTPTLCLNTNVEVALAWKKYPKMAVLAPYIDVQAQPVAAAHTLASMPRGALVVALGAPGANGWQKVGLTGGTTGYTRQAYLGQEIRDWTLLKEEDMRWNIVESALAYNGTAYRAGGRTPLGIDSVGLAAMAYMLNGVTIWRETFLKQGMAPHAIKLDALDEGDLLYFRESVGVYIGDEKFIHATTQPGNEGVVLSSMRKSDENYRLDLAEHIVGVASIF